MNREVGGPGKIWENKKDIIKICHVKKLKKFLRLLLCLHLFIILLYVLPNAVRCKFI